MSKIIKHIVFILCIGFHAAGQDTLNHKYDFMGGGEVGMKILTRTDSSYLIFCNGPDTGNFQVHYIREIDFFGNEISHNIIRQDSLASSIGWYGAGVVELNKSYYISGNYFDTTAVYITKIHEDFDTAYVKIIADSGKSLFYRDLDVLPNKTLVAVCSVNDTATSTVNTRSYILDTTGNILNIYNYTYLSESRPYYVKALPDSGWVIGGQTWNGTGADREPLVTRFNKNGQVAWQKILTNSGEQDHPPTVNICQNGDIIVGYCVFPDNWLEVQIHMARLDGETGNVIWDKTIGSAESQNSISNVMELSNGSILGAAAIQVGFDVYGAQILLAHNGDSLWTRLHHAGFSNGENYMNVSCNEIIDGQLVCGGTAWMTGSDSWLFRTDSCGCITPGCDPNCISSLPPPDNVNEEVENHELLSLYPNPNDGTFNLSLQHSLGGNFRVYDMHGRLVFQQLIKSNTTSIALPEINSGVYYYSFHSEEGKRASGKLVLSE